MKTMLFLNVIINFSNFSSIFSCSSRIKLVNKSLFVLLGVEMFSELLVLFFMAFAELHIENGRTLFINDTNKGIFD